MLKNLLTLWETMYWKKVRDQNKTLRKSVSYQKTKCCTTIEGEKNQETGMVFKQSGTTMLTVKFS
jgi:hypothetical protein